MPTEGDLRRQFRAMRRRCIIAEERVAILAWASFGLTCSTGLFMALCIVGFWS
jgi:hypothetical protein